MRFAKLCMEMDILQKTGSKRPQVQIIKAPNEALLRRMAEFQCVEADWFVNTFELTVSKSVVAVVKDEKEDIIGVASINKASENNYWIGNVVVAVAHRRKGWASTIVSTLLEHAAKERHAASAVLLSSPHGKSLYQRLGFSMLDSVLITEYDRPPMPPPMPCKNPPTPPNQTQFEQALDLYFKSSGVRHDRILRDIFEKDKLCVVLQKDGKVVASAWGRRTANYARDNKPCVLLGPVVATSPDYAISVTAEILRMEYRYRSTNGGDGCCLRMTTLLLDKGFGEAGKLAFEALGFARVFDLPVMAKKVYGDDKQGLGTLDFAMANSQYIAITGWDFG